MSFPFWIHGSYRIRVPSDIDLASKPEILQRIQRELNQLNISDAKVFEGKVEFVFDWAPRRNSPAFFDWNRIMMSLVTHGEVRLDEVGESLLVTYQLNTVFMLAVFLLGGAAMGSATSLWLGLGIAFALFTIFYLRTWSFFRNFLRQFLF